MNSSSNRRLRLRLLVLLVGAVGVNVTAPIAQAAVSAVEPAELVAAVRDIDDGVDRKAKVTMVIVDESGKKRTREFAYASMDVASSDSKTPEEMRMIHMESPKNVAGTSFLIHSYREQDDKDDDQWVFLPALRQTRQISTTDKDGAFVGSDFAMADLERVHVREFSYRSLPDAKVGDKDCYVIEGTAIDKKIERKTGYSKKVMYIWKDHPVILQNDFFDKKGRMVKQYFALRVEKVDDKWSTTQMKMKRADSNRETYLIWENLEYDVGLQSSEFDVGSLAWSSN